MPFKRTARSNGVPDSPDKLLLDLPRRKIPDVLPHQREIMRTYAAHGQASSDVAMQMATGSGKTLVGLLIGEWLRRKNQERVVYLCPTKQLVNQVVEQAEEKYGLTVLGFVGRRQEYAPSDKAEYRNADHIAITNYSSLFNTNPYFSDADIVICDDAHAAENYVADFWSLHIERGRHEALHVALRNVLKPILDPTSYTRLCGKWESSADRAWVDKIPTPRLADVRDQLIEIIDVHSAGAGASDLKYSWSIIREHLDACHVYVSTQEIFVRPLIPPTSTHGPFSNPRQRIYMSATLGAGGDLERLMGRKHIDRLPVPEGWDRQGVGRRFFIFPEMSLKHEQVTELRFKLMRRAGRSLVLVPNDQLRKSIAEGVADTLKFPTFNADDIEKSKKPFVSEKYAVAAVASRYDGIDFPGDECRLLFIEGLPRAVNLQERFLMSRMGANLLFNERIQTRILQAMGRCTRSLEDFSAVVVSGNELTDYLVDIRRRKFLHPEMQAELAFGVEQSKGVSIEDIIENFGIFLENGEAWEEVNQEIVAQRKAATQEVFPAMNQLHSIVSHEVAYQEALWQGDYEAALASADRVLGGLDSSELRGYRALWHYLAGSAAWLGAEAGDTILSAKARTQFGKAKGAATGISWLVALSRYHATEASEDSTSAVVIEQLERVEAVLAQLGTVHDRSYAQREKTILEGLASKEKGPFEQAHRLLGELIGFDSGKEEIDGSPDPWWIAGEICFVFEDHAGAQDRSAIDVTKARQASSHPNWMRDHVEACANAEIIPVLVTPVSKAKEGALPHLTDVSLWPLSDFRAWAETALATVREVRSIFPEPGNLIWRARAAELFQQNTLDAPGLAATLKKRLAKDHLKAIK